MILDHGCGKGFLRRIAALLRQQTGLDFEHVAGGGLHHEVNGRRRYARGRIHSGLFSDRLSQCGRRQKNKRNARSKVFHSWNPPCFSKHLNQLAMFPIVPRAVRALYEPMNSAICFLRRFLGRRTGLSSRAEQGTVIEVRLFYSNAPISTASNHFPNEPRTASVGAIYGYLNSKARPRQRGRAPSVEW